MASLSEVKGMIAEKIEDQSGHIVSQEDLVNFFLDHHLKQIEDMGFVSMDSPEINSQTERNYSALITS